MASFPVAFSVGMRTPNGPWGVADTIEEATIVIFSTDTPLLEAEQYLVTHKTLGFPAFYWNTRGKNTSRELLIPVLNLKMQPSKVVVRLITAGTTNKFRWLIRATSDDLEAFYTVFKQVLKNIIDREKKDWNDDVLYAVLREGIENAARHGNSWKDSQRIEVELSYIESKLRVRVRDEGTGFDWEPVLERANTCTPAEIARMRGTQNPGGMGMSMMVRVLDVLQYNESGNELTMGMN